MAIAQSQPPVFWKLLIVENGLAIALKPLMGGPSGQVQHWVETQFPVIVVGVEIAFLTATFRVFISRPQIHQLVKP
ncbi:hypothetical protein H6G00_05845 [Leptolyngbya sp. FACHB-541]|uniref:hypothetical protein n=1 Tax=Leptolyngbya sp. FACHB-541 TaxID=2692810 RepID=UPI001683BF47|nr:hypothetical protein [Leptolyngbya sp. FACHB-541]MBD1866912.1 hypothetical protein [Cyanobacteria bacterium FACHB-471]MBD1996140.1 hypothetical protein [Leptolyngbya sp. FACHB-541]